MRERHILKYKLVYGDVRKIYYLKIRFAVDISAAHNCRWQCRAQQSLHTPAAATFNCSVLCSLSAHGPRSPSWIAPSRAASLHTAPARHLGCNVVRLTSAHARLRRGAGGSHSTLGTLVGRAGCEASARWPPGSKWNRTKHKEKKKVRLYFITQTVFLLSGNS